jgi:N-acyl-L-homoserine lactone synthetase
MSTASVAVLDRRARELLDRVAGEMVRAAPVKLELANADQREAVFRLRWLVAVERGWLSQEDYPDELERDADDEEAAFVVGWDRGELVATARVLQPQHDGLLPLERTFDVRVPAVRTVQLDRVAIRAGHRGTDGHAIVLGVLARAWQAVSANGAELISGVASPRLLAMYREIGIVVTTIGEPRLFWGERRQAFLVDLPRTAERLAARPEREAGDAP